MIYVVRKLHDYAVSVQANAEMKKVILENVSQLFVYAILRLASDRLLYENRSMIITSEVIRTISPLSISGNMKEKLISYLFNLRGLSVVSLFYPIMNIKIKLFGHSY